MLSLEEVKSLITMIEASSLTKFEFKTTEGSLLLEKTAIVQTIQTQAPSTTVVIAADAAESVETVEETIEITAPMVGTFYLTPEPDAEPFVKVGTKVEPDSIVCILEAMKLFTEIEADCSGQVVEILAKNGELVEYGQPLFKIKAC